MENNDLKHDEELLDQETIIDEPWAHQFEEGPEKTTRSARNHDNKKGANLYTKIIFGAIFFAIVVVATWAVLRGLNIVKGSSGQNETTPPVPRLVLQSQTTSSSGTPSDESATTTSTTTSSSLESSNIETSATSSSAQQSGRTHVIKSGESAYSIASKYGITVSQFYTLNGINANTVLLPGQTVIVSSGTTANSSNITSQTNTSTGTYTIKSGDSLSSIAAKHGMTLSELKQLNGFTDKSLLLPGQTIKVRKN